VVVIEFVKTSFGIPVVGKLAEVEISPGKPFRVHKILGEGYIRAFLHFSLSMASHLWLRCLISSSRWSLLAISSRSSASIPTAPNNNDMIMSWSECHASPDRKFTDPVTAVNDNLLTGKIEKFEGQ